MTLIFPDTEALHCAISCGLIPDDLMQRSLTAREDDRGRRHICTQAPFPTDSRQSLANLGVEIKHGPPISDAKAYSHWLQLFPLQPIGGLPALAPRTAVLLELNDAMQLPALAHELLRQRHDRAAICQVHDGDRLRTFVRIIEPPYYTLLSAFSGAEDAPLAFLEAAPRVWVQLGFQHEFAEQIILADHQTLLLSKVSDWQLLPELTFHDLIDCLTMDTLANAQLGVLSWPESMPVSLRLAPSASTEPATFWVVRENAVDQLDAFVQRCSRQVRQQLAFAVADRDGRTLVTLRLRPTRLPPPNVDLFAEAYRPWLRLPNLYVPVGSRIDPPLRRATIQKLLAPDASVVTWLAGDGQAVTANSIADEAFHPLSAWIDGILERDHDALTSWAHRTEFAFSGVSLEASAGPVSEKEKKLKPPKPRQQQDEKKAAPARREVRPLRRPPPIRDVPRLDVPAIDLDLRHELTELETQFLAIDGGFDHPERQALWPRLAELNAALRQPAEATLAWTHAWWDAEQLPEGQLWQWVQACTGWTHPNLVADNVDRLLSATPVTAEDVRAVAAVTVWSATTALPPGPVIARLADVQAYLQANERLLPVRAAWLAWCGWAQLAGNDTLAMVRARDRMLTRLLESGLDADADLPTFLRFAGRLDSDRLRNVREWFDEIRMRVRSWYSEQTKVDLSADPTAAYIDLFFAFSLARLGEATAARALVKQSEAILDAVADDTRDAHLVLLQALSWRVEELLAGRPHSGPLPPELLDYLAQMHVEASPLPRSNDYNKRRTGPYAVERFREQSRIVEPLEKFDPYRHTRREGHDLVREAARLPDLRDPASLAIRIRQLLRPAEGVPELELRIMAQCLPMAGRLSAEAAGALLERVAPLLATASRTTDGPALEVRLRLIERSLFFAAHFDRTDLIPSLVNFLVQLLEMDAAVAALEGSGQAMGQTLRSLRKLGLRDDTVRLLERLETALLRGNSMATLTARPPANWSAVLPTLLHLAAGWIYFDQPDRAAPILDAARKILERAQRPDGDEMSRPHYVQVICNLIAAYGLLPPNEARTRIADLLADGRLDRLPNTFTTASFYSRFHLNVAEAVVLTLSGDDFTLGPSARRWLDEGEYMIRRRIHRDVKTALERG